MRVALVVLVINARGDPINFGGPGQHLMSLWISCEGGCEDWAGFVARGDY